MILNCIYMIQRLFICCMALVLLAGCDPNDMLVQPAGTQSESQLQIARETEIISFDSEQWEFDAEESRLEEHMGQPSLYLKNGIAIIKDAEFTDGIIEYDVSFGPENGFVGGLWRMEAPGNFEFFYMRAHLSDKPDATQYEPFFYGVASWQLYAQKYGKQVVHNHGEWNRVKIVVSGDQAEAYINDMEKPAMFIDDLKRETAAGAVGMRTLGTPSTYVANFGYTAISKPPLQGQMDEVEMAPGTIESWSVSSPFAEDTLVQKTSLSEGETESLNWQTLAAENTGLANLARLSGLKEGNTVFARAIISSETAQAKALQFGFSDRIRIYLNNQLLYAGDDGYGMRDYRFLGTIGYHDKVYLSLEEGENELLLAVSEDFGGWGVQAKFEDTDGISVVK